MKSLLILVLVLALTGAAWFTRPSKADFENYVVTNATSGDTNFFSAGWDKMRAQSFVNSVDFQDHLFWVTVQQNGTTIYTGAFAHWFNRSAVQKDLDTAKQTVSKISDDVQKGVSTVKSGN